MRASREKTTSNLAAFIGGKLGFKYSRPSLMDHSALALAMQEKCPLLSGDKDLRVAAKNEGVEIQAQTDVGHSAENMGIFRRLIMNMAVIVDPERGMASVRRAATFGVGYLKGILGKIFLE